MADVKISNLPASTTPLVGSEVLPVVQGGVTKKVSVDNLTAGKPVSATQFTSTVSSGTAPLVVASTTEVANLRAANATSADTANQVKSNSTTGVLQVSGPAAASTRTMTVPDANFTVARTDAANSFTSDQTLSNGNLVIGTSGKGIDFSATTSGSGTMTSELLSDYEEGTWTPAFSSTGATFAYSTQSGTYTKIGRFVYAYFILSTSGAATGTLTNALNVTGLPYSAAEYGGFSNTWGDLALVPTGIASTTTILLYQQGTITQLTPTTSGLSASNKYFVGAIVYSV